MKVLPYVSFLDVIEVFFAKHKLAVFKLHFLSVLPTLRVLLKHAFSLVSISMHFSNKSEHIAT